MFRRRSSQSNKVGPVRRASILNTLAADEVINNDTATEADVPLARGTNPLFKDGAEEGGGDGSVGDRQEESVSFVWEGVPAPQQLSIHQMRLLSYTCLTCVLLLWMMDREWPRRCETSANRLSLMRVVSKRRRHIKIPSSGHRIYSGHFYKRKRAVRCSAVQ